METESVKQPGGPESVANNAGEVRAQIVRGIVALHKEAYGKGPVRVKAYLHEDSVLVLLRGGFTPIEQTLHEAGRGTAVVQQRLEVQAAMREPFVALIEAATGRKVVGFMSGAQPDADLQCEVFVLDPSDLLSDENGPGSGDS